MLMMLIKEFVAICDYILASKFEVRKDHILIDKKDLTLLLDKNRYLMAYEKLKIWKELRWIDTEENRYTKRVYYGKSGGYKPMITINIGVYEALKRYQK